MVGEQTEETQHARVMLQGQSNCWGVGRRAEIAALGDGLSAFDGRPFERVFILLDNGTYEALEIGKNNSAVYDCIGCEFGLAVRWMRETTHGNLYIDKQYLDGMPISYFQDGHPDRFFEGLKTTRASTNKWLETQSIRVRDVGWLWVQGEADHAQDKNYYLEQLNRYTNSLKSSSPLLLPTSAKMVLARQIPNSLRNPDENGKDPAYGPGPDDARLAFAAAHPMARLISYTNNFNQTNYFDEKQKDYVHLNAKGQVQLAYDAYEQIFNAPHRTA